jgi:sulfite reductase alpha subunit-like flavoprotein
LTQDTVKVCACFPSFLPLASLSLLPSFFFFFLCISFAAASHGVTQVFGLGNKTYEQYQAAARFVNSSLVKLGAKPVHPMGEGDDNVRCALQKMHAFSD